MASYPGSDLSISQLLEALDRKLDSSSAASYSDDDKIGSEEFGHLETQVVHILARLRTLRNACSPVNRLLPETLALVFRYVANECHAGSQGNWTLPYHWISITHVCRYWYDTALYFPSLWSIVDSTYPAMAQMCFERSKSALLDMKISGDTRDGFLLDLQLHISRCRLLQSDVVIDEKKLPIFQPNSGVSAPILSHHQLQALNLRHLCLRQCVISQPFRLKTLVTLDLAYADGKSPAVVELLDMLESNPLLEHVTITNAVNIVMHEFVRPRLVRLNRLETFKMVHCAAHAILEFLYLRHGVHLEVERRPGSFARTLPSSLTHLENMAHLQIFRLSPQRLHALGPSGSALFIASIHERSFGLLAERGAKELWLGPTIFPPKYKPSSNDFWSSLGALETLVLIMCSRTVDLLKGLEIVDGKVLLPCLRDLTIYDDPGLRPLDLSSVLQARTSRGYPVQRLKIIFHPDRPAPVEEIMVLKAEVEDFELEVDEHPPKWPFEVPLGAQGIFPTRIVR